MLLDRLQQSRASSEETHSHCALMFLDIDRFKQLNDTLGHEVGDILLRQVSQRLLTCVRAGDCVSRFGGDEFVVLLNDLGPDPVQAETRARDVANQMLQVLSQTYNLNNHAYDSTLSAGVVVFLGGQEPVGDLLRKADLAMYRAKSQGRNTMCLFDQQMLLELRAHETLAADMRQGLVKEEFVLHCQIQLNAQGRAVGAEAHVLWRHASQGLMSAENFMGLAEESGTVLPLGKWVLQAACLQLVAWAQNPQTAALTLAVNLGASQLAQADFAETVTNVLKQTGAPAAKLILVLTEGALVNDVEGVIAKMNALKILGVGFCLDDFGVGFPSLAYLKRLPLVQLKMGRLMVQAVLTDESVAVIARAILALGFSLGVPGLAEGVSTAAQRRFFVGLGCQVFQGEFFGAPAAPADMLAQYEQKWLTNQEVPR
jgi:diguanylate cyclase (GGDEF)-like protein